MTAELTPAQEQRVIDRVVAEYNEACYDSLFYCRKCPTERDMQDMLVKELCRECVRAVMDEAIRHMKDHADGKRQWYMVGWK